MRSSPFFTLQQLNDAVAVRHQLHQHPELKFEEADTAKLVAERLKALGYQVTEGIASTGVLAELDTGREGPVIAFRADMDALPIKEANGFAHHSQREGLMHACGHDGCSQPRRLYGMLEVLQSNCSKVQRYFLFVSSGPMNSHTCTHS